MSQVRTVLGDIDAARLGVCYAHEHIIIDRSYTTEQTPDFLLDSVEWATDELKAFRSAGGRAMVDSMPIGGGRNVVKLADVSRRSGVHILCPTGLHLAKYYRPGHWSESIAREELAELFIDEIQLGIDANEHEGPAIHRKPHRAGLIKVASGLNELDSRAQRVFGAAADAHHATGAPILTHTEQGTAALEQIQFFQTEGVHLEHVVLSHTDRKPDLDYHKAILDSGVNVEYDSAFRWPTDGPNYTADLVVALVEAGYERQIMLGMDAARRGYWRSYGGEPGLTYLLETFVPLLQRRGLGSSTIDQLFVYNPASAYSLAANGD